MHRWIFFNLAYYQRPIWDTGISPPELMDFIATHAPGQAIELGSGSGTNAVTLAKAGWKVTGVDFAHRAIRLARKKARQNGVQVDFHMDDVTRLGAIHGPFDLILDIGCFHSLSSSAQSKYSANIERLLAPTGTYLLYAFFKHQAEILGPGITEDTVHKLREKFELIQRQDGNEGDIRPSAWLTFKRRL